MKTNPYVAIHHSKALTLTNRSAGKIISLFKGLLYNYPLKNPGALQVN